jgi:hypothetical protein
MEHLICTIPPDNRAARVEGSCDGADHRRSDRVPLIPREHGGLGADLVTVFLIVEEIS